MLLLPGQNCTGKALPKLEVSIVIIMEEQIETSDLIKFRNAENQFQRIPIEVEAELLNKIRQGDYRNIHVYSLVANPKISIGKKDTE